MSTQYSWTSNLPRVNPIHYRLKPIDIKFMRSLHDKVNIVPVIAKADTLTKSEIRSLKARVCIFLWFVVNTGVKNSQFSC